MRQSLVRGRLIRFLAGMRAYEMQQSSTSGAHSLPSILAEFIAWAGDFVSSDMSAGSVELGNNQRSLVQTERAAQRLLNQNAHRERNGVPSLDDDESDQCCICHEGLHDASVYDEMGEPVATACGHLFHAVCLARLMEASETDVWCPLCRSGDMAARFL